MKAAMAHTRRLYFANDTSTYHAGSYAVCEVLRSEIGRAGWQISAEDARNILERERIEDSDAVLVNGEGTLHRNKPRARHLMQILRFAQEIRKPTILCNASWSAMSDEHDDVLGRLSSLSVREPFSAAELRDIHRAEPDVHLDLSYYFPYEASAEERDIRFLTTDLYSKEFDCFVWPRGGRIADVPKFDMMGVTIEEAIEQIRRTRVFITGRFHGLMLACKTRTRFIAYAGNTHKLNGMVEGIGRGVGLVSNYRDLYDAARGSHRNESLYSEFFDALDNYPRWRFPL